MTIVIAALFTFGAVMAADSEELTQEGIALNGPQVYTTATVQKIFEIEDLNVILGTAGDSQIYISGWATPQADWLLEYMANLAQEEDDIPFADLAASLRSDINDQPMTEWGQNSPSTILWLGRLNDIIESYRISNVQTFDRTRLMDNQLSLEILATSNNLTVEPTIYKAGFREAQTLFDDLFVQNNAIQPIVYDFLATSPGTVNITTIINKVNVIRALDKLNIREAEHWLRECVELICDIWKLAGKAGIGRPVCSASLAI